MESYNLTDAKAKFSDIISRVVFARENITIKKKGKNVAVVVPYEDYVKKWVRYGGRGGLLLAKSALADIEELDQIVKDIYKARENSIDRNGIGV